jgi:hypothetical protein
LAFHGGGALEEGDRRRRLGREVDATVGLAVEQRGVGIDLGEVDTVLVLGRRRLPTARPLRRKQAAAQELRRKHVVPASAWADVPHDGNEGGSLGERRTRAAASDTLARRWRLARRGAARRGSLKTRRMKRTPGAAADGMASRGKWRAEHTEDSGNKASGWRVALVQRGAAQSAWAQRAGAGGWNGERSEVACGAL